MGTQTRGFRFLAATAAILAGVVWMPVAVGDPPAKKKGDADGKDDRPGKARWEWKILDAKGKAEKTGTFTGYQNGDIKHGKDQEKIGSFEAKPKKITATFTKGPLKGEVKLVLSERKPIAYRGELVRGDGTKADVEVVIIND